jgi:SAM-dependent methyltransferase
VGIRTADLGADGASFVGARHPNRRRRSSRRHSSSATAPCCYQVLAAHVDVARRNLKTIGASVVAVGDEALPFSSNYSDLLVSRHPVITPWEEIARVLVPGGTFPSQQVGAGTNRELTDFFMGPQPIGEARNPERHVTRAEAVGLRVDDLRDETLLVEFFDVGAVAYFLRKVLWTVPGFTIDAYRERLQSMHLQIERDGRFISHSRRFLIRATKPV